MNVRGHSGAESVALTRTGYRMGLWQADDTAREAAQTPESP